MPMGLLASATPGGKSQAMADDNNPHAWLNEHGDYLYRYAISRLHNEELASDMLQEALLAGWKGRTGFSGQSSVRTWLIGILKHKIIDHIRKQIRERNLMTAVESDPTTPYFDAGGRWHEAPQAWQESPEALCSSSQFQDVLEKCMRKLPTSQQTVFRMREINGEDSDAICKSCDITSTNLHVLLYRARMALRNCLQHHWFEQEES